MNTKDDDPAATAIEEAKQRLEARADNMRETTNADIANNHRHHPPITFAVSDLHEAVRNHTTELAQWMNDSLPESDEKQEALKAVRLAMMWANTAVACHSNKG